MSYSHIQTLARSLTRSQPIGCLFLPFAATYIIWYIAFYSQLAADDAYIHMRIARNFITHGVPYFNPEQVVASSSSVLWLLVTTGLFALFGAKPLVIVVASAGFMLALFAATIVALTRRYRLFISSLISFALILVAAIDNAALLMETPLALCCWVLSIICLQRNRFAAAGVFAGLSFATRYEFIVWVTLILLIPRDHRQRLHTLGGACLPLGSVAVFNLFFFQTLVPNTVRAKSVLYEISPSDAIKALHAGINLELLLVLLLVSTCLVLALFRQQLRLEGAILGFGATIIALYVLRGTFIFPWYIPIFIFSILFSCSYIFPHDGRWVRRGILVLAMAFGLIPSLSAWHEMHGLMINTAHRHRAYTLSLRVQQYLALGEELTARYPHASMMTSEIGALGWAFPGTIIDAAGLASPECLIYHPMPVPDQRSSGTIGAIPPQAVQDLQPDLIVSMEYFTEALRRDMAQRRFPQYQLQLNYPVIPPAVTARYGVDTMWNTRWIQVYVREQ
jgi:hypothetical protein